MQRFRETPPIGRDPLGPNHRPSLRDDGLNALVLLADARSPKPSDTPRVKVAKDLHTEWDLAKIVTKTEELAGAGFHKRDYYACDWDGPTARADFNKMCSDKDPRDPEGKTYAETYDASNRGQLRIPSLSIRQIVDAWEIYSVRVYALIVVYEPADGAYPEVGKNVTTDPKDGVRGGNPPTANPNDKGYYKKVAENLRLYKSAEDKDNTRLRWWIKGNTLRHEEAHHQYYRDWFDENKKGFLNQTATQLEQKLRDGKVGFPINAATLESAASRIFSEILEREMPNDFETQSERHASAISAREFQSMADEIERKGKELEAKSQAAKPSK